jgi:hypothetical protein
MKKLFLAVLACGLVAAPGQAEMGRRQRVAMFVGIDVSGSFHATGHYPDALRFLAQYIHGHLNGLGELEPVKSLFVGSIGGNSSEETKSFRPIEDFKGKSVAQIEADLKQWYPRSDSNTDFDTFFRSVAMISQKRNLSLTPIEVVLVTDGVPDTAGEKNDRITKIDVSPLEFLSRRVTLRVLYPSPTLCTQWENRIARRRLRIWTVDDQVMSGWSGQIQTGVAASKQDEFLKWVMSNVDFRVRPVKYRVASRS